jgi:triphosphoribosyl-dephospho-CoA synthase
VSAIADAYVAACLAELDALKPGNVHRHAEGHGMTVADFETSARVSAAGVARRGARVGARVLEAVTATRTAVGQNTNLGIVLLCAPLAAAAERDAPLPAALTAVLDGLDLADARDVFAAIALANPGGLGSAERHDVREPPTVPLREAMAAAADRDLVARQYARGFADVLDLGLGVYARARVAGSDTAAATAAVYLAFLAAEPDSHVARKFGREAAEALRRDAAARLGALETLDLAARHAALAAWDAQLKARGLNPGATADLTVATVFAARLSARRDERLAAPAQQ